MTNVLLADDHAIIRASLKIYIENILPHSIVEEAFDGDSAFDKIKHSNYDLIILDINMPDTDSFDLVTRIMAVKPGSKILIFSMNPGELYAGKFLHLGVLGYLNKAAFPDEIRRAIECVISNKRYLSPSLSQAFAENEPGENPNNQNPFALLSRREREITKHLMRGESTSQIASFLYLDTSAVCTHQERIFEKLDCKNIVEMNELALTYNFVQSD